MDGIFTIGLFEFLFFVELCPFGRIGTRVMDNATPEFGVMSNYADEMIFQDDFLIINSNRRMATAI